MAEMNEIFTRLQLKHDSYANWDAVKNTFRPLPGEICVVEVPSGNTAATTAPTVLFKVGQAKSDTENYTFAELPWASALAADVYAWAKASDVRLTNKTIEFVGGKDAEGKDIIVKSIPINFATPEEVAAAIKEVTDDLGDVTKLTTTAKTVVGAINEHDTEIGNLSGLGTKVKTDLVAAINSALAEALDASEKGGAGSVVTIEGGTETNDKVTYTVKQGGTEVGDIEIGAGDLTLEAGDGLTATKVEFGANDTADKVFTVSHAAAGATKDTYSASEGKLITGFTTDEFGHITGKTEGVPFFGNRDNADEDANGTTLTVGYFDLDNDTNRVTFTGTDGIKVKGLSDFHNVEIDGSELLQNAKDYTDEEIAKAHANVVDYLGVANALTDLAQDATKGDFYRVGTEIKSGSTILAYAGDLIVAEKDAPAQQIDGINWTAIHSGDGDISNVIAGNGLTGGGSTGEVTISHKAKPTTGTAQGATAGSGRTYITEVTVDEFGHVAGVKTATETDQDLSGYKTKQTAVTDKITDAAHVIESLTQNANGEISYTVKKMTPADIGAQNKSIFVDQLPTTGEEDTIYYKTNKVKYKIKEGYAVSANNYLHEDSDRTTIMVEATFGYSIIVPHEDTYQTGTIVWYAGSLESAENSQWNEYEEEGRYIYPIGTYVPSVKNTASSIMTYAVVVPRDAIQSYTTAPHYAAEGCYGYAYKDGKWECIFVPSSQEDINHVRIGLSEFKEEAQEQIDNISRELESMSSIAKTGSIYDVTEGSVANTGTDKGAHPKYLIFNCGTSTTVI